MKSIVKNTRCSNQTQLHSTLKNRKGMNMLLNNLKLISMMGMKTKTEIEENKLILKRTEAMVKDLKELNLKEGMEMDLKPAISGLNKILSKKETSHLWETKNSDQKYFYKHQDLVEIDHEPKSTQPHLSCLKKEM